MGETPSDGPRVTYSPHPHVPAGEQFGVLESIYALAIQKAEEQEKAGGTNAGEGDPKGPDEHDRADHQIIQA